MTHKYTLPFLVVHFFPQIFEHCLIHCAAIHHLPGVLFKYLRLQPIHCGCRCRCLSAESPFAYIVSLVYYTNKKRTAAQVTMFLSQTCEDLEISSDTPVTFINISGDFKGRTGISRGWLKNKNLKRKWTMIFLKAWQTPGNIFWCLVKAIYLDLFTDVPFQNFLNCPKPKSPELAVLQGATQCTVQNIYCVYWSCCP